MEKPVALSIKDYNESFNERLERLPQTLRLAILVSIFWPIFSFIFIVEPRKIFILSDFIRKFALMAVLPLVFSWGLWWVIRGFKKDSLADEE